MVYPDMLDMAEGTADDRNGEGMPGLPAAEDFLGKPEDEHRPQTHGRPGYGGEKKQEP